MRILGRSAPAPVAPTDIVPAPDLGGRTPSKLDRQDTKCYASMFGWTGDANQPAPRLDEAVRFKAQKVPLHSSWSETGVGRAMGDGALDLNLVTSDMLAELSPSQLKTLTGLLAGTEVTSEVHNARGGRMSKVEVRVRQMLNQPRKINGATALLVKSILSGDIDVTARLVAAAPEHALPVVKLKGQAQELVRGDNMVRILHEMRTSGFGDEPREIKPDELDSLGTLLKLSFEAARDRDDIDLAQSVRMLFHEFQDAKIELNPDTMGILAGAVVAGLAKVDEREHNMQSQAKRVTNHAWAASWLLGPLGGIASSIIVGLGDAYSSLDTQEMTDLARQRRNRLEAHWLQHPPPNWTFEDRTTAMQWVDLTIRSNRVQL